jgi:hypothetical protein
MGWHAVYSVLVEALLHRLPGWIVKRFYPKERMLGEIELDVRSTRALQFTLSYSPSVSATLRLTNKSAIDVELRGVELELWDQQPLCTVQEIVCVPVASKATKEIFCRGFLNEWQAARAFESGRTRANLFTVYARVLVVTPFGLDEIRFNHKENVGAEISGTPTVVAIS